MGSRTEHRGRWWTAASAAAVALVVALVVVVVGGSYALPVRFGVIVLATLLAAVGVDRNRPTRVLPWLLLLGGMAASAVGDVVVLVAEARGPVTANVPADAWLTAVASGMFLVGLLDATRPVGRGDAGRGLDALIATLAGGAVVWQLVVVPAAAPGWNGSGTEQAGALQVAVLLTVLILLLRVVADLPPGRRAAATALSVGVLAALVAFVIGALRDATGGDAYAGVRAGLGVVAYLSAAAAALHPSMRTLTEPRPVQLDPVSLPRTLGLGVALAAPPGVLLIAAVRGTDVAEVSLSVIWVALAAAVLARVHHLQRGRDAVRDELLRSERRLNSLVANTGDAVFLVATPRAGTPLIRFASPACTRLTGLAPEQVQDRPVETLVTAEDAPRLLELVTAPEPLPRTSDVRVTAADGSPRWVEVIVDAAPQEEERSVAVTLRDIDERKRAELLLAEVALRDELTGLWNRRGIHTLLAESLEASDAGGTVTGVILGDLDGFKLVNDRHGHAAGDEVLRVLASRLQGAVRDGDVVGRVGGDEFLVVCRVDGPATLARVAERVVAVGVEPLHVDGVEHRVGVSAGVALGPVGSSPADLLSRADAALYEAKGAGKGRARHATTA